MPAPLIMMLRGKALKWFAITIAIAFIIRFWNLSEPAEVVYDEVTFGSFINDYLKGSYFVDTHPHFAKLFLYYWSITLGYAGKFDFSAIGNSLSGALVSGMRSLPAILAAIQVAIAFVTIRALGGSVRAAILSSWLLTFENLNFGMSKFLMVDAFLWFGSAGTFLSLVMFRKQKRQSSDYWWWLIATGFCLGFAVSTKWSALAVFGFVGLVCLYDLLARYKQRDISVTLQETASQGTVLIGIPLMFLLFSSYIHLKILTTSGSGDEFHSPAFQKTLYGSKYYHDSSVMPLDTWGKLYEMFQVMYGFNTGEGDFLTTEHPWQSPWYSWPALTSNGVCGWSRTIQRNAEEMGRRQVYMIGNPTVFYLVVIVLGIYLLKFARAIIRSLGVISESGGGSRRVTSVQETLNEDDSVTVVTVVTSVMSNEMIDAEKRDYRFLSRGMTPFFGYCVCLLPYALLERSTFIYSYASSLYFGVLLCGMAYDALIDPDCKKQEDADASTSFNANDAHVHVQQSPSEMKEMASPSSSSSDAMNSNLNSTPKKPRRSRRPIKNPKKLLGKFNFNNGNGLDESNLPSSGARSSFADPSRFAIWIFRGILAATAVTFFYFSPLQTGKYLSEDDIDSRMWNELWML